MCQSGKSKISTSKQNGEGNPFASRVAEVFAAYIRMKNWLPYATELAFALVDAPLKSNVGIQDEHLTVFFGDRYRHGRGVAGSVRSITSIMRDHTVGSAGEAFVFRPVIAPLDKVN